MSIVQHKAIGWIALLLLLAVGTLLRGHSAARSQFWEDEAESSINAQTILSHGVPTDTFLGEPIYENIMLRSWPGHAEYEFKDLSYSDKGVAVYHGWLPLYTMAGSMAAFGQAPDQRTDSLKLLHGTDTLLRRTVVPRLPAITFAVVFMVLMYMLGRSLGGPAAGWAALVYAAVAKKNVYYGSQARYYSLTLVLIAGCGWVLWRIIRHGRWRDYLLGSAMWVLLFHTHVTSCLGMCVVALVSLPWHRRAERVWIKRVTAFGIVAAGTLPWVWWTGYLQNTSAIPSAWRMAGFGSVVLGYPLQRPVELGLFVLGITAAALAWAFARRMPTRMVEAFGARRGAYALVSVWAGVMFLSYALCMPAASFFMTRLSLMIAVPCILLASMIVASGSYLISHRWAHLIAPATVLVLLAWTGRLMDHDADRPADPFVVIRTIMDHLNDTDLPEGTRLYATPNNHLVLTYYTGLPIQSVAPIRKAYLDSYPGPMVIFEKTYFAPPPEVDRLRALADRAGVTLDQDAARDWAERIHSRVQREEALRGAASVSPAIEPIPDYLIPVVEYQRQQTETMRDMHSWYKSASLMFRGYTIRTSLNWWQTYQYRFVDPASRSGDNVNYADRARSAVAVALPRGRCIVYHCPPPDDRE